MKQWCGQQWCGLYDGRQQLYDSQQRCGCTLRIRRAILRSLRAPTANCVCCTCVTSTLRLTCTHPPPSLLCPPSLLRPPPWRVYTESYQTNRHSVSSKAQSGIENILVTALRLSSLFVGCERSRGCIPAHFVVYSRCHRLGSGARALRARHSHRPAAWPPALARDPHCRRGPCNYNKP